MKQQKHLSRHAAGENALTQAQLTLEPQTMLSNGRIARNQKADEPMDIESDTLGKQ